MKRRTDMKERDDAVSPVIGVMLMIVVTLIIAAVVSAMAGGVFTAQSPAPTISAKVTCSVDTAADAKDKNCTLNIDVLSTSEVIDTKDLKITLDSLSGGARLFTTITADRPQDINGTGAGVPSECLPGSARSNLQYGKFDLRSGVQMSGKVILTDSSKFAEYDLTAGDDIPSEAYSDSADPETAAEDPEKYGPYMKLNKPDNLPAKYKGHYYLFNDGWEYSKKTGILTKHDTAYLNPGDKVSVKIIYIPNGQTVYSSDVKVVS